MPIAALLLAAATPAILTKEQAAAMTPAQLADLLLPAGHEPVIVATPRPVGMDAPSASVTEVDLMTRPTPGPARGFCAATLWTIPFTPVNPAAKPYQESVPMQAGEAKTEPYLRWVGAGDCAAGPITVGGGVTGLFRVRPDRQQAQIAIVRALVAARAAARGRGRLPFALTFAEKMAATEKPLTARAALAALPIERAWNVDAGDASDTPLPPLRSGEQAGSVGMDSLWVAEMTLKAGRITRLALKREVPPPF